MAQPYFGDHGIPSTASSQDSNTPLPGPSRGSQDLIQTDPAADLSHSSLMSAEKLPPAIVLMIEKEVEKRSKELRRTGNLWTDMPLFEKVWFVVSNCILLATFATTIWLGISQRRADQASVTMAQAANEANTLAQKSLQIANNSEATAIEALSQSSANNNITATNSNNGASQEMLQFEQYCEEHPSSNVTFFNATGQYNCSQMLTTSISLPTTCGGNGGNIESCNVGMPSEKGSSQRVTSVGIVVGVCLGVLVILAFVLTSLYLFRRRRRMNKNISGGSGTVEI